MSTPTVTNTDDEVLEAVFGPDFVDVTEGVTCYENGKTFQCDCDQWIGVEFHVSAVKCASCSRMVVDREADERGPPERDENQTGLTDWT